MPVPPAGSLSELRIVDWTDRVVLVTGASGYIASWICLYLLEKGYKIRGTTRNAKKGEWMKQMYKERGHCDFDFVIVTDLENVSHSSVMSRSPSGQRL